jgi:hypothetical protein
MVRLPELVEVEVLVLEDVATLDITFCGNATMNFNFGASPL